MKSYFALAAAAVVLFSMPAHACDSFLSDEELMLTDQKSEAEWLAVLQDAEQETKQREVAEAPK